MSRFWWNLPGPSAFLERISHDLHDRKNVVVRLPDHAPEDFRGALRAAHDVDWRDLPDDDKGRPLADLLLERFNPDRDPGLPRNVRALVEDERLHGYATFVEVEAHRAANCARWSRFLDEYATLSRGLDPWRRMIFAIVVAGREDVVLPSASLCLTHHVWDGAVGSLDMELYVAQRLRERRENPLLLRIMGSVIARVALWDHRVADQLASADLDQIFCPDPLLAKIAGNRGWGDDILESGDGWACGVQHLIDAKPRVHSAALVVAGKRDDVEARVWAGQVGVLFPLLEEQRRLLIARHAHRLHVPIDPQKGRLIEDVHDMELGHMLHQLHRSAVRSLDGVIEQLRTLVAMRNRLAHFEVVPAALLQNPTFYAVLNEGP